MRKLMILIGVAVMVLAMAAPVYAGPKDNGSSGDTGTYVCHVAGNGGRTILIHVSNNGSDNGHLRGPTAPAAHQRDDRIASGDGHAADTNYLGLCGDSGTGGGDNPS